MASKQHGLTTMNATRPKKKPSKKRNKLKARERKAELLKALDDALSAARGGKVAKPAKAPAAKKAEPKAKKPTKKVEEPKSKKAEEAKAE